MSSNLMIGDKRILLLLLLLLLLIIPDLAPLDAAVVQQVQVQTLEQRLLLVLGYSQEAAERLLLFHPTPRCPAVVAALEAASAYLATPAETGPGLLLAVGLGSAVAAVVQQPRPSLLRMLLRMMPCDVFGPDERATVNSRTVESADRLLSPGRACRHSTQGVLRG